MARWQLTDCHLSHLSGVDESSINSILKNKNDPVSWDTIQQIADGLKKLDVVAEEAFWGGLRLSDSCYPELDDPKYIPPSPHGEFIKKLIKVLEEKGLIDWQAVKNLDITNLGDLKANPLKFAAIMTLFHESRIH